MPASDSCTSSEILPSVDWDLAVAFLRRRANRTMGTMVTGTATKVMSDSFQSSRKQLASMTMTVSPSRR